MPSILIRRFAGMRPRVSRRLLPEDYAEVAHNTQLMDGSLKPLRGIRPQLQASEVAVLHLFPDSGAACGKLEVFDHCVSVVDFPAPGLFPDLDHFVVWHHDGATLPERWIPARNIKAPLFIDAPSSPPQLRRLAPSAKPEPYRGPDQRTYTYTWVDQFGVESPPAPPSKTVQAWDDEVWQLSGFSAPPPNAVAMRIYRSVPSFDDGSEIQNPLDTSFQLLAELEPPFPSTFDDTVRGKDIETGTLLTSWDQQPPPLRQVVGTEQGYLVGCTENDIWVSERFEAHNWPHRYRISLPDRIIALISSGDWVYVVTTGRPYRLRPEFIVQGDEADMRDNLVQYADDLPGLGRLAATAAPFGAIYASRHGLVALSPDRAEVITEGRIPPEVWFDDWAPNLLVWYRDHVLGWRMPKGRHWVMHLPASAEQLEPGDLITHDVGVYVAHKARNGLLYVWDGDQIGLWGQGDSLSWRWRSRIFRMNEEVLFGVAKIVADGPVTFRLFRNGELVYEKLVTQSDKPFRLPRFSRGLDYQVELTSEEATVHEVHVATSLWELAQG